MPRLWRPVLGCHDAETRLGAGNPMTHATENSTRHPDGSANHSRLQSLLDGRLAVGHEFFLIALNDRTGKLRLNPDAFGLGLAGALVGELVLSHHLTVNGDALAPLTHELPPDTWLAAKFARLIAEPHVTELRTWLRFFATTAESEIAGQLQRHGWVDIHTRKTNRSLGLRTSTAYLPRNTNRIAWRSGRLAVLLTGLDPHLRAGHPVPWPEVLLAGLLDAVGLLDLVLWHTPRPSCRPALTWCLRQHPALYALVTEVGSVHAGLVCSRLT
ncbi:Golgi phosphoprotein 3 (GPP34) [Micromonospora pattaloongensis]|uniref:Golgi phosphoprotein 3 (GPP34) n=1 Tax=Micromonospora pattaloongensis TaxID=405436 RepID=A0A1H3JNI7_9ACTN|nr:GPP34 family phosphoprotein [Micromonospora pattaloongensis]SDY41471.1 Golgi phosphoprotein 3 (GPP34) [Micromonospora pattaloongensis]